MCQILQTCIPGNRCNTRCCLGSTHTLSTTPLLLTLLRSSILALTERKCNNLKRCLLALIQLYRQRKQRGITFQYFVLGLLILSDLHRGSYNNDASCIRKTSGAVWLEESYWKSGQIRQNQHSSQMVPVQVQYWLTQTMSHSNTIPFRTRRKSYIDMV